MDLNKFPIKCYEDFDKYWLNVQNIYFEKPSKEAVEFLLLPLFEKN